MKYYPIIFDDALFQSRLKIWALKRSNYVISVNLNDFQRAAYKFLQELDIFVFITN